ncbi:UNVERIFIED_CONTAM: hypothetical protein GTU68_000923 [Idotea baltica]|nr:hypothetical protein [Idotea baltica]
MNISIVGTGYVGLVTGTCFADVGNQVYCVDKDQSKIDMLLKGQIPIYEPGLERLVGDGVEQGRLKFTTDLSKAINHAEIIFIAVGTPPDEDGSADLSHVLAVAKSIGQSLTEYRLVVTKSTVPVGTAEKVRMAIQAELDARGVDVDFGVASNPEFLKEGAAIQDFMKPDRVVVGVDDDDRAIELLRNLYAPFNRNHDRLIVMDIPSAELTKYAANAMLATKISFMNELSNLAELLDADIELVRQGIGSDPRIGYHFIYPGCGYGGSCFPKDVQALHRTAGQKGYSARILNAVEAVNQDQKSVLLNKIDKEFGSDLSGKSFAIWGLSFKPNTDDMREAPSTVVINGLLERGASVKAYDPVAKQEASHIYADQKAVNLVDDLYEATDGADALVIVTEWKTFRSPNFAKLKQQMISPIIFDGRNIYDPNQLTEHGFKYRAIGRSN